MRAEKSFSDWGHMQDSDTRRQRYGLNIEAHLNLSKLVKNQRFFPSLR